MMPHFEYFKNKGGAFKRNVVCLKSLSEIDFFIFSFSLLRLAIPFEFFHFNLIQININEKKSRNRMNHSK